MVKEKVRRLEIRSTMCYRAHAHCCLVLKRSVELQWVLLSLQGINRPQVEEKGRRSWFGEGGVGKRFNR